MTLRQTSSDSDDRTQSLTGILTESDSQMPPPVWALRGEIGSSTLATMGGSSGDATASRKWPPREQGTAHTRCRSCSWRGVNDVEEYCVHRLLAGGNLHLEVLVHVGDRE
eukprot:COSAG02_NODE_7010_length_3228_cov_233.817194_4_plen_109_part_01